MNPARFEQIQALFLEALEQPEARRQTFLEARCGANHELLAEVSSMLDADASPAPLLDHGIAAAAESVLTGHASTLGAVGPYRIERLLGEGGMGSVYFARRTDLGTPVAIKVLKDAPLSPARRDRFLAEQRTLAALNHPFIARLYDAGMLPDGTPWIVMEYVDGVPITEYCRRRNVSFVDRLRLVRAVAEAVRHAHRHLIVHRDLKPANVLVTGDGEVKLLDFGIAKQLYDGDGALERTQTAFRVLTPAYAAPEQIRGDAVGLHTDVYGLGAMLYELLAGRPAFDLSGKTPGEAEFLITQQEPERPSLVAASTGGQPGGASPGRRAWAELDVLCLSAMHKEPGRRYDGVDAFVRDIDHYLKGEPLEARPDSVAYRVRKFATRNWEILAATAAVAALVIGLVAFYTVRLTRARDAAIVEATRAQRVQDLLRNLFTGGETETGPAESLRIVDIIDRGILEAEALSAEPIVQADLFHTLGTLSQTMGRFDSGAALLEKALVQRRTIFGVESGEAAQSLIGIGMLRLERGEFDAAERMVREGLAIVDRQQPRDNLAVARATTSLGRVLEERGTYADAIRVLERAVQLQPAAPTADLVTTLRHLGNVNFYAGNLDRADELFRRVLAMTRQVHGDRHARAAEDLINVGAVQFERAQYAEAERFYREALPITEGWYGKDRHQTASNLTMLGRALVFQQRYDEALEHLQRALAIQERVFGPVHPRVASALNEIGNTARQRKQYEQAAAAFTRMADIYRAVYQKPHNLMGTARSNLGSVFMDQGQFERAEAALREAVAIFSTTQSPTHLNTGIARIKLGRALLNQRRYEDAERETLGGFEILTAGKTSPTSSFMVAAREDLAKIYAALGQQQKAESYLTPLTTP
jgi:serine/threonine-protein kinase